MNIIVNSLTILNLFMRRQTLFKNTIKGFILSSYLITPAISLPLNNPQLIQEQNYSDILPQSEENLNLQNMSGGFMQTIPEENNQDPSILMEQMQKERQLVDQEYGTQPTTGIIPNARPPPEMRNEVVTLNSNQTPEFLQQSIDPNIIQNNYHYQHLLIQLPFPT